MLKCVPLSFGLIGLYRLKLYMYYSIRIYTVHVKNIWAKIKMLLTGSQPQGNFPSILLNSS